MDPYQEFLHEGPTPYHELNKDGIVQRVSRAECELLGFTEEQMIGRPIWDFVANEEIERCRISLYEKLDEKRPIVPFRRTYVTSQNRYVVVQIHDRLIRDSSRKPIGIRSTLIDVTEATAAERSLEESRQWLEAILRSIHDGVIALDGLGSLVHMNPAAENLTGWKQQEVAGSDFEEFLHLEELNVGSHCQPSLQALFQHCLMEDWCGTGTIVHRVGSRIPANVRSSPLSHGSTRVAGLVLVISPRGGEGTV